MGPFDRIDVHHHMVPPVFANEMQRRGISTVAGEPIPKWNPDRSLQVMDENGIQSAILSLSAPGVYFGDLGEACDLARRCNEYGADLRVRKPNRFGMFAVLPMPFVEQSCKEAVYALDVLKADGVVLLGSTDGVFLGDSRLDELMQELHRREAVVFVHPNLHPTSLQLELSLPGFLLEFLCDTTRAAANLTMTGTLEKYPGISWILAHAGGFLPYVAWRLSLANLLSDIAPHVPQGVLTYIKRFYFDTALSPSPYAIASLRQLVDSSNIVFGSDFPFAPAILTTNQIAALEALEALSADEKAGIRRGNGLTLFPRLKKAEESLSSRPTYGRASPRVTLRRIFRKPLLAFAERARQQ